MKYCVPTTPTTVKMQAATAANTVAGREKWMGLTDGGGNDAAENSGPSDIM